MGVCVCVCVELELDFKKNDVKKKLCDKEMVFVWVFSSVGRLVSRSNVFSRGGKKRYCYVECCGVRSFLINGGVCFGVSCSE